MKNYYFDPKSQDLYIFDPSAKEMLVLERIVGVHVLTSSEIERPIREEDEYHNHNWNAGTGKAKKIVKVERRARLCKVCGKPGRTDYHEKQGLHKDLPAT